MFDNPDLMISDLKIDSLGIVEIIFEVEDHYGLQIDDPGRYASMSYNEMVEAIEIEIRMKPNDELTALEENPNK